MTHRLKANWKKLAYIVIAPLFLFIAPLLTLKIYFGGYWGALPLYTAAVVLYILDAWLLVCLLEGKK